MKIVTNVPPSQSNESRSPGDMDETDFKLLAESVREGDCVLFLGPKLWVNAEGRPLDEAFAMHVCDQMRQEGITYDEDGSTDLCYAVNRYIKGRNEKSKVKITDLKLKKDYAAYIAANRAPSSVLDDLLSFPFPVIINTNPDSSFVATANRKFWHYDVGILDNEKRAQAILPNKITNSDRLVVNVFGDSSAKNVSSIIVREAEYLKFSQAVHAGGNGIPEQLKVFIQDKICFFVGFQYDSWPLKILLHALNFPYTGQSSYSFSRHDAAQFELDFFADDWRFQFIPNHDAPLFNQGDILSRLKTSMAGAASATPATEAADLPLIQIKSTPGPVQIVFIRNPRDEDGRRFDVGASDKIAKQLLPLAGKDVLSFWTEDMLSRSAGDKINEIIDDRYRQADIFIVIGSAEGADEAFYKNITKAADIVKNNPEKLFIGVLATHFLYEVIEQLTEKQWIPREGDKAIPIRHGTPADEDRKLREVSEEISRIAKLMIRR